MAGLLLGAGSVPAVGWAHWEGVDAADPATPAAVLRFESAASGYTEANATPVPWRTVFEGDGDSGEATGQRAWEPDAARTGGADDARRAPATAVQ